MMKSYYAPRNKPKPRDKSQDTLIKVDSFVPRTTYQYIKDLSDKLRVPISRLIAQAIDNEMDAETPFNYPCPEPDTEFVEGQYFAEAQKIFQYLEKFPKGADIETLVISRRDFGIESRELVMYGLRELLNTSLVEYYKPTRTVFHYPPDYMRIRVVPQDPKELKNRSNRLKPLERDV